jgi:hypothetical protein
MNESVLKRDLFERVIDGVKVMDVWEENVLDIEYTSQTYDTKHVGLKVCIDRNERFKPILFSTSCLTKPIQIKEVNNGETFVPIDMLISLNISEHECSMPLCRETFLRLLNQYTYAVDYWVIEMLKKWHINFRLNSYEFFEPTDSFNPYK